MCQPDLRGICLAEYVLMTGPLEFEPPKFEPRGLAVGPIGPYDRPQWVGGCL